MKKLVALLLVMALLLSSCYYPIHDGNGEPINLEEKSKEKSK